MDSSRQVIPTLTHDAIGDALNIAPIDNATPVAKDDAPANTSLVVGAGDMDIASTNLKSLATKGEQALDEIMEVANLSQHPRAYEVVATTLNALAQVNRTIIDAAKAKGDAVHKASGKHEGDGPKSVTNQNVFVGSTADLAKFLDLKNGRG